METSIITIKQLVSEAQCYATIRQLRWVKGVSCLHCDGGDTIRRGFDNPQRTCQRYQCKACGKGFDDLTGTVLSGHHQPLSVWVLCLYFTSAPCGYGAEPVQPTDRPRAGSEQGRFAIHDGTPAHGHR